MPFHIIWYIQLQPNVGLFSSFRAICRDKTKQGVCPKVPRSNKYASCTQDCSSDSDCDGDEKCCFNGNTYRVSHRKKCKTIKTPLFISY